MRSSLAAVLAIAALANAAPTDRLEGRDEPHDWSYIIDPWNNTDFAVAPSKLKRDSKITTEDIFGRNSPQTPQDTGGFVGWIPSCDSDPSLMEKTTMYAIDQGIKIPSSDKKEQCASKANRQNCWTEYFLVESAIEYVGWQNTGAAIDCRLTSECTSAAWDGNQTCTAVTRIEHNGWEHQVIEASGHLDLYLGPAHGVLNVGGGYAITHDKALMNMDSVCIQTTDVETCYWDDKKCHQVWFSDRVLHVWGQAERVCTTTKKPRNAKHQKQYPHTQRANGDWVRGQIGFDFLLPANKIVGCSALCSDTKYDLRLENSARQPFVAPAGWGTYAYGDQK